MAKLAGLIDAVRPIPEIFTVGKIAEVDEVKLSVSVTPEDGSETIYDVPIRIRLSSDNVGASYIPVIDTPCIVVWLISDSSEKKRPKLFAIQEWSKIKFLSADGFGLVIEAGQFVKLGDETSATHPLVYGDDLATFLGSLKTWADTHDHIPGPPPSSASPAVPSMNSEKVKTS